MFFDLWLTIDNVASAWASFTDMDDNFVDLIAK